MSYRLPPTIRQLLASSTSNTTSSIRVNGWVKSIRRQKKVAFAVINDGSSANGLQAVFNDPSLTSRVRLSGQLVESPGSGQEKELQVESVEVLGECDPETYPIQKQALSVEYLRDYAHLRARTDTIGAMLRLRDAASRSLRKYFEGQGFCYAHTPLLTSNDCEGAGEAFRIAPITSISPEAAENALTATNTQNREFFSRPSYLTVSSQLHLEALASSISRVYTLSPCFRAERSQTSRHLAEFWMLEAEWAFSNHVEDICAVVEGSVKEVLSRDIAGTLGQRSDSQRDVDVLWKGGDATRRNALNEAARADIPWPRMTYTDAIRELEQYQATSRVFKFAPKWGLGLQSEHERWLAENLVGGPVFVTDYPATLKPFYMRHNADGATVACFDLLVPYLGELAGGSLREERYEVLEESLQRHGLGMEEYGWYADLRKFGGAPHGGFGMGFERLLGWIGGIDNVRECIAMPRWAGRALL